LERVHDRFMVAREVINVQVSRGQNVTLEKADLTNNAHPRLKQTSVP
jgi:hypothetical protein